MNDDQLPEWAQRRKAKDEAKRLKEEADRQSEIAGSLRIQHEAPQIVSDLLSELQVNVEAAKKLGFSGGLMRKSEPLSDHIGHVEVISSWGLSARNEHKHLLQERR